MSVPIAGGEANQQGGAVGLLVGVELSAGHPVLSEEDAVVGREDEHRVAELAELGDLPVKSPDGSVDRTQRREAAPKPPRDRVDAVLVEEREATNEGGLVADVGLVE